MIMAFFARHPDDTPASAREHHDQLQVIRSPQLGSGTASAAGSATDGRQAVST
jgi:hypothetical protein